MQFPDPHFKARHKKRRVVQPQLVRAVARLMPAGGDHRLLLALTFAFVSALLGPLRAAAAYLDLIV